METTLDRLKAEEEKEKEKEKAGKAKVKAERAKVKEKERTGAVEAAVVVEEVVTDMVVRKQTMTMMMTTSTETTTTMMIKDTTRDGPEESIHGMMIMITTMTALGLKVAKDGQLMDGNRMMSNLRGGWRKRQMRLLIRQAKQHRSNSSKEKTALDGVSPLGW